MDIEVKAWLFDILNAVMEIESYFLDSSKTFSNYKSIYELKERMKEILK